MIGSPTYFLSKQLCNILSCSILKRNIKNNINLIDKLKDVQIPSDHVLISLDVTSLYTNVSKELVKNSIIKRYRNIVNFSNIPLDDLLSVTDFIMSNTFFKFNYHFYQQSFGTPMGSPISGFSADIVMNDLETQCLNLLSFKPIFCYRYVDDIITCISKNNIDKILSIFNDYNKHLQCIHETEINQQINFLNVSIINYA